MLSNSLPKYAFMHLSADIRARDSLPKGNISSEKADIALINSLPKSQIYNDRQTNKDRQIKADK